jgi:hypothetical protein
MNLTKRGDESEVQLRNWVNNYAIERERGVSNKMEVFKYGVAVRGHPPVETGAQLRSTESRHSQRAVTKTVIAVRRQTQPNLSHPSKWNGELGSTQAGNLTQRQPTNHSQANWPIEAYISWEPATRKGTNRREVSTEQTHTLTHFISDHSLV